MMPVSKVADDERPSGRPGCDASRAHCGASYAATERTTPQRNKERMRYERAFVHEILDEAMVCHVAFVADGRPVVLPTIPARVGERLYVHASTGSRLAVLARDDGVEISVAVTLLDGLVLARSAFHHSMNYRSVVAHGRARIVVDDAERQVALDAVVDHLVPGRSGECRPPSPKELAATAVLALDLDQVAAKVRSGDPVDDDVDLDGPWWAGVVPVTSVRGPAISAADCAIPVPTHLA